MKMICVCKRVSAFLLAFILLVSMSCPINAETLAERLEYSDDSEISDILFDTYYYDEYKKDNYVKNQFEFEKKIDLFSFADDATDIEIRDDSEKGKVIYWDKSCKSLTYNVTVPQDGFYEIYFDYYCIDGNGQDIARGIKVNGEFPYEEAKNFFLRRSFVDANSPKTNNLGDQVMPAQVELKSWKVSAIYDNRGMYSEPLSFFLKSGENTVSFEYVNQPMLIADICIKSVSDIEDYETVKSQYKEKNYKEAEEGIRFEAESYGNVVSKSASSILIANDSDSTMTPKSISSKKFNYIGGGTWASGGGSITWKFSVKESGLYKIAFRSVQNANSGMPSHRKIEIDGEVPFAEMQEYVFEYSSIWKTNVLADGEEPYLFYLEGGEHTLTVTAVNGQMTDIVHKVTEANSKLSNCYQNIVMITGQSPDVNYDYELDRAIPSLKDDLSAVVVILEDCIKTMGEVTNETATLENSMRQIVDTINGYKNNIDAIPTGLADFTNALTNMGDWISTLQKQYLAVDYIEIASPSEKLADKRQSLWDRFVGVVTNWILSYTKDYNAVGVVNDNSNEKTQELEVWISESKERAEILKDLADSEFSAKHNVNINVNLLPAGAFSGTVNTLLLSVNAGNIPDVVLNMTPNNTAEYALRDVIYDLTEFEDFNSVKDYTLAENYKPISYNGGVYGLPEKMGFKVLIYRKDIFEKLHIQVPNTWDDVYNDMLPKLYQYNLQMYLPADFEIFLFQNGGEYYTADMRKSALDSDSAFGAFDKFIKNYTDYGFPYSANFYNRFRTGEIPIGIGGLDEYLSIAYGAPELSGKWSIAPIPATVADDGKLNRSVGGALSSVSVIMKDSKNPDLSWEFLKWWTSAETQTEYASRLESILGVSARWSTANVEAYRSLPWSTEELEVIDDCWNWVKGTNYVPGGYFTSRNLTNAISRCMTGSYTPRNSLEEAVEQINTELQRKREDLKID